MVAVGTATSSDRSRQSELMRIRWFYHIVNSGFGLISMKVFGFFNFNLRCSKFCLTSIFKFLIDSLPGFEVDMVLMPVSALP